MTVFAYPSEGAAGGGEGVDGFDQQGDTRGELLYDVHHIPRT